jgi:hypothetical protein
MVDLPTNFRIIEPYENESLMYYLAHKKHMPGRSRNQVIEIEKLCLNYSLDVNGNIKVRIGDTLFEIPKKEKRLDIMKIAHHWGHFQKTSVIEMLKQNYRWPNLEQDVDKFIKACSECQRERRHKIFEHPAKPIEVQQIFDRVQIDLVFGLPETKEGYIGIMIIMEALSN